MNEPLSVNRLAWKLLDKLIENADLYGVKVKETSSGTRIIDAGIEVRGGYQAGKVITEICMGGCGQAELIQHQYGNLSLPSIQIYSDHPVIATLGSQYAGWRINEEGYIAIGSGPARALAKKPKKIYEEIQYEDDSEKAVIVLETDRQPPAKVMEHVANDCGVMSSNLAVILAPTTSLAGATQVSGRIVETGIHKLSKLGLDPNVILYGWGFAPIPSVHPKPAGAMARTNDAILYGGTAHYVVEFDDEEELEHIAREAPSVASRAYGKPFMEIFKEASYDFYKIDPNLFAPACVIINNTKTGNVYRNGEVNADILAASLGFSR